MEIYCLICSKQLRLLGDNINFPPNGAVVFFSYGNYGSSVFDMGEFTNERLEMYICDDCLVGKSHKIFHIKKSPIDGDLVVNKLVDVR